MVLLKRADNKNSYIKKLIKNIKTVNIELDNKDKIIKELEYKNESLEFQIINIQININDLNKKDEYNNNELDNKDKIIKELKANIDDLTSINTYISELENNITNLTDILEYNDENIGKFKNELNKKDKDIIELKDELAKKDKNIIELKDEFSIEKYRDESIIEFKYELTKNELTRKDKDIIELKDELTKKDKDIIELKNDMAYLRDMIEYRDESIDKFKNELSKKDKDISELKGELSKKDTTIELKNDIKKYIRLMENELTKKDNTIIELKDSIKKDIRFNENFLSESYLRIYERFPHLNLQEIISFEKKVRDNGGNIKVHSGTFILLDINRQELLTRTYITQKKFMEWSCGPVTGSSPRCCSRGESLNRDPCTGKSAVFYLKEEDEKMKDIKSVNITDVSKSIEHNIKILKETIEKYSEKIKELTKLNETLNLLI